LRGEHDVGFDHFLSQKKVRPLELLSCFFYLHSVDMDVNTSSFLKGQRIYQCWCHITGNLTIFHEE